MSLNLNESRVKMSIPSIYNRLDAGMEEAGGTRTFVGASWGYIFFPLCQSQPYSRWTKRRKNGALNWLEI